MSLRVFETDPEAQPKKRDRYATDLTFDLKSGIQVNNVPQALTEWGFTTDDPSLADTFASLFGGEVEELDVAKGHDQRVLSTTKSLTVLVADDRALRSKMILFGNKGPIHECDGMYSLMEEDKGEPCGCPPKFEDRKAKAKSGRGPSPSIELKFLLADHPELGFGRFRTGSWTLVKELPQIEDELAAAVEAANGQPVKVELRLELVEYTTRAGRDVSFTRPVITVIG